MHYFMLLQKLREQAWLKEMHKKTQAKYLEMKRQAELAKTTVAAGQPEESVDKKLRDVERNMKQRGEETIKKSTEHLVVQGQADNNRIPVVENKERPVDRLSLSDDLGSRRTASPISDSNQNNVNNNNVQNSNSDNNNNIPQWNSNNNDNNQPQFGQVNDNRQQEFQQQPNAQRQPQQPQIGGINLSWDWEDFSIMFNNYGAAEMKVRRAPHPSTGEPWPMPQYYSKKDNKVSHRAELCPLNRYVP